jgi:hypothetical protein
MCDQRDPVERYRPELPQATQRADQQQKDFCLLLVFLKVRPTAGDDAQAHRQVKTQNPPPPQVYIQIHLVYPNQSKQPPKDTTS